MKILIQSGHHLATFLAVEIKMRKSVKEAAIGSVKNHYMVASHPRY